MCRRSGFDPRNGQARLWLPSLVCVYFYLYFAVLHSTTSGTRNTVALNLQSLKCTKEISRVTRRHSHHSILLLLLLSCAKRTYFLVTYQLFQPPLPRRALQVKNYCVSIFIFIIFITLIISFTFKFWNFRYLQSFSLSQ